MQRRSFELPPDPLARFGELYRAVLGPRTWLGRDDPSRFAALFLVPLPGDAGALAAALAARAEELRRALPWWSSLRSSLRFALAALLVREEVSARVLWRAVLDSRVHFRRHWRFHGSPWEELAAIVLILASEERRVTAAQLERLAALWQRMKRDRPWLTQRADWPACAALSTLPGSIEDLGRRLEALYSGLGASGLSRGGERRRAAQLLCFAADEPPRLCARVGKLWRAFREAGLWMHAEDHDEVALLAFVDAPAAAVVGRVLRHRAAIAALRPRPSRATSFDLACGTTLLELLRATPGASTEAGRIEGVARLVSLLQVQQAAMVAAASAGAVAAAAH